MIPPGACLHDGRDAEALSRAKAAALLDRRLGEGPLILTDNHAAKAFLESRLPERKEHFVFYDSPLKCFSDDARERFPGAKLIVVSAENAYGAEALETGAADYFVNVRELYRIFLRTGGAPSKRVPVTPEPIPTEGETRFDALLADSRWCLKEGPEAIALERDGINYSALLCRNLRQAEAALDGDCDVLRILA